jgi:hypothetical protein
MAAGMPILRAYQEEIGVMPDEIWKALHDLLGAGGIEREDAAKWEMDTAWKDDVVRRGRGFLKAFIKSRYDRRYRFHIRLAEKQYATVVFIRGIFREKPSNSHPSVQWQTIQPESEDYGAELEFFKSLIAQLSKNRLLSSSKSPGSEKQGPAIS